MTQPKPPLEDLLQQFALNGGAGGMNGDKAGAGALILGALASVALMLAHPTGHELANAAPGHGQMMVSLRGAWVHGVAIASAPVLTFGYLRLSQFMGFGRWPVSLAFIFYAFAAFAVCLAALMSGFVTAPLLVAMGAAQGAEQASMRSLAMFASLLNQIFALSHVMLGSIAILLWSAAWKPASLGGWALRAIGLLSSIVFPMLLLLGHMRLDVHGMLAVVLGQGAFAIGAAFALWRGRPSA